MNISSQPFCPKFNHQPKLSISIQCADHQSQTIGLLDLDSHAKKLAYCFNCIAESSMKGTVPKVVQSFEGYMKDTSRFYEECRARVHNAGDIPSEYNEELLKKAERLEKLTKHIDEEKSKVKQKFEDIRKIMVEIINEKERECVRLLEKEVVDLSESYSMFEKLLLTGWPKPSEIQAIYPNADALEQRLNKVENIDQLQAFVCGVKEDINIETQYNDKEHGLHKRKGKIEDLIARFQRSEISQPQLESQLLNTKKTQLNSSLNEIFTGFIHQEVKVSNSISSSINVASKIANEKQLQILQNWLPKYYQFRLKLLFRGSANGLSAQAFHKTCDGQGPTITLIKCRFDGAESSSIIGGFTDQSWHSNEDYTASDEAFLFLLESRDSSLKCPIIVENNEDAIYGGANLGPIFGGGHDLWIRNDLKTGYIKNGSYWCSQALHRKYKNSFNVEEIEVFQVQ